MKNTATGKKRPVRFAIPSSAGKEAFVAGTFNDWNPQEHKLTGNNGAYAKTLRLAPGRYEYKFVVDGRWEPDMANAQCVPDSFGGINNVLEVP